MRFWCLLLGVVFFTAGPAPSLLWAQDGASLYRAHCVICHEAEAESQAPARAILGQMDPEQILAALERGAMRAQGAERSRAERRALAEFLSGKPVGNDSGAQMPQSAFCDRQADSLANVPAGPAWNGWGVTITNSRFQPSDAAGLTAQQLPQLKMKWAFGFPGASSASAQPVVWGGRVFVGSWEGDVYSLDAKTGCIHWTIQVEAGVRSAITIGKPKDRDALMAYFGDLAANVYAVEAATGKQLWKVEVDDYPFARITGSPTLHDGRLYVPVSSREESQVRDPRYPCCRFRGSLVALDAATGKQLWKTYTIPEPRPSGTSRTGLEIWGPSGASIWVAPTLDVERKAIYVGTSNNYSPPSTSTSDAVIAFDMESGEIRWVHQLVEEDIWNGSCRSNPDPATCPEEDAPDADIASSPILVQSKAGRDLLIVAAKNAVVYALDPDQRGKLIWQRSVGRGGTSGGVMWGPATDQETLYVAVSDAIRMPGGGVDPDRGGGLLSLDVGTGEIRWNTPHPSCGERKPCSPAQAAAVSAIPGVVFSGSEDGRLRAYAARDGKILWEYDTVREYTTVNGVKAKGGSIDNGGVAVAGGMLYTNSGYSHHGGIIPGNVFLAFSIEE
ncbi:MAG: PQQ-binding-like beta-propeller repeat protein [Acidobacteria bacterium]|nr:PQQ-binding-like beta-propeller repeat protein [Acidobacteriota bacterium]